MKKYIKLAAVITSAVILSGLAIADISMSAFFSRHFLWGTKINDLDAGGMTIKEVKEMIEAQGKDYELELELRQGKKEVLKGDEIGFCYTVETSLKGLKDKQNGWAWPFMAWQDKQFEAEKSSSYDEEALKKKIDQLDCVNKEKNSLPEDATLQYLSGSYEIVAGKEGSLVDEEKLCEAVEEAVGKEKSAIDVDKLDCYKKADVTVDSPALKSFKEKLDKYLQADITYDFGDRQEHLSKEQIHSWVMLQPKAAADKGNASASAKLKDQQAAADRITEEMTKALDAGLDISAVRTYVDELAEKYDTLGNNRSFKTTKGKIVQVPGGDYGWQIDKDQETVQLMQLVEKGAQKVMRTPLYDSEGYCRNSNDIGNSYVEVDLTNQHLWFYFNGKLVTQGDIVSGTQSNGHATPAGTFSIDYRQAPAILRGPGYACPVSFWMPFYDGMGIHDAVWRGRFGGTIYVYNGSHGCLNAPYSLAQTIYQKIEKGMPVVCYH